MRKIVIGIDKKHIVETTGYAKIALETAEKNEIDLFILDIQLLDYSGLELAKQIRNIEKYKMTPIIFITSIVGNELKAFREIHCYAFLKKPFSLELAREKISEILTYGIKAEVEDAKIIVKKKGFTLAVFLKDIIFIDYISKKLRIVTEDDEIMAAPFTFGTIQNELNNSFVQCHRGIIVNRKFVKKIDKSTKNLVLNSTKYPEIPFTDLYRLKLEDF